MRQRYAALFALGFSTGVGLRELVAEPAASPAGPEARVLVSALARGLTLGEPVRSDGIVVFPLVARSGLREPGIRIVTLLEAMERAWVTLRQREGAEGPVLAIDSWADAAVFITGGQLVPGSSMATDTRLAAGRDCLLAPRARGIAVPVTRRVADDAAACGAALPADCEGSIAVAGPRVVALELFPNAWFYARMRTEAGDRSAAPAWPDTGSWDPVPRAAAGAFLASLADLPWAPCRSVDLGFELAARTPDLEGSALFVGGALVHLAVRAVP